MKEKMTFEQEMDRLEEIVSLLENGQAPLDEMMKLYEEGAKLVAACSSKLDKAKLKVKQLSGQETQPQSTGEEAQ